MREHIIELRGVTKTYAGNRVLDRLDLSIERGVITGLAGRSGEGCSTLVKLLGGHIAPDAGTIAIDEYEYEALTISQAMELGICLISQDLEYVANMNVASNIFLGREPLTHNTWGVIDGPEIERRAVSILEKVGLHISPSTPLHRLSVPEQYLVKIAQALSMKVEILILDNITASLHPSKTAELLDMIRQMKEDHVTVLFISDRVEEVCRCADRVVVLQQGAVEKEFVGEQIDVAAVEALLYRELSAPPEALLPSSETVMKVDRFVSRSYPDEAVSFHLLKGEMLGFTGLLGAGRSEIMQALCGIDGNLGGSLFLEGKPVSNRSPRDAIRNGIFYIPEDRLHQGLVAEMTARENMMLAFSGSVSSCALYCERKEAHLAKELCEKVGLKEKLLERPVGTLAAADQQRVQLAKGLATSPRVMIVDEPTRGVHISRKESIYAIIRGMAREGVSVILITSDIREAVAHCHRVAVMHEGRLQGILAGEHVKEEKIWEMMTKQEAVTDTV